MTALAATFVVFLFLKLATSAFAIGDVVARFRRAPAELTAGQSLWYFVAGVVVLALLRAVPGIGALVVALGAACGLGAWTMQVYRAYTGAYMSHAI